MNTPSVNTIKLKRAIQEFGSLQEATDILELRKNELTSDILAMTRNIDTKKRIKVNYVKELNELDSSIKDRTQELDDIVKNITNYLNQYRLFEGFLAMLSTSPSKEEDLEKLADNVLVWSKVVWTSDWPPDKMKWLFVHVVLGKFLHCYQCSNCKTKFITNKEFKKDIYRGGCPFCGLIYSVAADDSFLEAMLGSYKNIEPENPPQDN